MRSVVLIDLKIDKDEALALLDEFGEFFEEHTGIECTWWLERRDFSQVPTMVDSDGDMKPTHSYRKEINKDVHKRYNDYGTDNVVMWVHEDNFLYKGIWGQNWSGLYHKHSFQLCRWDKNNDNNTFGTLYHELMHSFDWVVKDELGIDIDFTFGYDWDASAVHGKGKDFEYIGGKTGRENTEYLKQIGPHITKAFKRRKERHETHIGLLKQVINIAQKLIDLLSK